VLPTVHKRFLGVATAAFVALLGGSPAHASAAPRMKAAYTVDADRDGHVDGVAVRWSKKVRGGRDSSAPFAFSVAGYRVTRVAGAHGRAQRLSVAERPECDTGGSIRIAYSAPRRGAGRVAPRRGKGRVRSQHLDMRRFDPPVPRITCAVTLDSDHDARVDGVRLTYSRAVRNRAQHSGRFLFSVLGYRVAGVEAASGRFLKIDVAERGPVDSSATPAVGYTGASARSDRPYAVRSGRRATAFAGTFESTRDGVSPKLLSARTGDADRDGRLDSMTLHFSERVRGALPASVAVLGMRVRSVTQAGDSMTLALAEGSARGDARPGTWIADGGVTDLSGNATLRGAVTPADGAAPVLVAAVTRDSGGAPGQLDAVAVTFSEPVAHPRDTGGVYPFLVGDHSIASVDAAGGRTVQVRLTRETGRRCATSRATGPPSRTWPATARRTASRTPSTASRRCSCRPGRPTSTATAASTSCRRSSRKTSSTAPRRRSPRSRSRALSSPPPGLRTAARSR
jgi:hypothetical protein